VKSDRQLCRVCTSAGLSVRVEQLGSRWMDFHEIWYLSIFWKVCQENLFYLNLTRMTGTLHPRLIYVFDRILLSSS